MKNLASCNFPGGLKPSRSAHSLLIGMINSQTSRDNSLNEGISSIKLAPAYHPFGDSDQCDTNMSEDTSQTKPPIVQKSLLSRQASTSLLQRYQLLEEQSTQINKKQTTHLSQLSDSQILQQLKSRSSFKNVSDSLVFQKQTTKNKENYVKKNEESQATKQQNYSDKQGRFISSNAKINDCVQRSQEHNTRDEITQFRATDVLGISPGRTQTLVPAESSPWKQRQSENHVLKGSNNPQIFSNIPNHLNHPNNLEQLNSNQLISQNKELQKRSNLQYPLDFPDQIKSKVESKHFYPKEQISNVDEENMISSPNGLIQFQEKQFLQQGTSKSQQSSQYENDMLNPEDLLMNTQEFSRFQEVQLQINSSNLANTPLSQQCPPETRKTVLNQVTNNEKEMNIDYRSYDVNSAWNRNPELNLKAYSMHQTKEANNSKGVVHLNSPVSFANLNQDIYENSLCSQAASLNILSPQFAPHEQIQQYQQQHLQLSQIIQMGYMQKTQINNQLLQISNSKNKDIPASFGITQSQQSSDINNQTAFKNQIFDSSQHLNSLNQQEGLFRQRSASNISSELTRQKEFVVSQKTSTFIEPGKLLKSSSFSNLHNNLRNNDSAISRVSNKKNSSQVNQNKILTNQKISQRKDQLSLSKGTSRSSLNSTANYADTAKRVKHISLHSSNNQQSKTQSQLFSSDTIKSHIFVEDILKLLPATSRESIDFQTLLFLMINAGFMSQTSFQEDYSTRNNIISNQIHSINQTEEAEIEQKLFFVMWTLLGGNNQKYLININTIIQLLMTIMNLPIESTSLQGNLSQFRHPSEKYHITSTNNTNNSQYYQQRSISPNLLKNRTNSSGSLSSLQISASNAIINSFTKKKTSKVADTFSSLLKKTTANTTNTTTISNVFQKSDQLQQQLLQIDMQLVNTAYESFLQDAPASFLESLSSNQQLWNGNEDGKTLIRQIFEPFCRNRCVFQQSSQYLQQKSINLSLNVTGQMDKELQQVLSSTNNDCQRASLLKGKENIIEHSQVLHKQSSTNDSHKKNGEEYDIFENRFEKKYNGGIYSKNINKLIDRMRNTKIDRDSLKNNTQSAQRSNNNQLINPSKPTAQIERHLFNNQDNILKNSDKYSYLQSQQIQQNIGSSSQGSKQPRHVLMHLPIQQMSN